MALSIKTKEADRLARALSRLTGESMTEAVTKSLAERLNRERKAREDQKALPDRIMVCAARLRASYDMRAVSNTEWDKLWGETE